MWSGFFFYSPRPPSQKQALVFLTMLVVVVNSIYMAVLLYSMCSETCKEHESNVIVKSFRRRTSSVKHVLEKRSSGWNFPKRRGTQHVQNVQNPIVRARMEIEMINIKQVSAKSQPETLSLSRIESGHGSKTRKKKKKKKEVKPQRESSVAQQMRKERLKSLHARQESCEFDSRALFYTHRVKKNPLSVGGSSGGGGEEKGTAKKMENFQKVEDVEGDCFENVQDPVTDASTWIDGEKGNKGGEGGEGGGVDNDEELEILKNEDGRKYIWNPKTEQSSWMDEIEEGGVGDDGVGDFDGANPMHVELP